MKSAIFVFEDIIYFLPSDEVIIKYSPNAKHIILNNNKNIYEHGVFSTGFTDLFFEEYR